MGTNYVYVLDKTGRPLMPTTRYGKVRRMLKSGLAKVKTRLPFTIQLTYEPETRETQRLVYGCAPGQTNIGSAVVREDGVCVYLSQCVTANRDVTKHMDKRRMCRRASRRGERLRRIRRALHNDTTRSPRFRETKMGLRPDMDITGGYPRLLPGYSKPMRPKKIRNTEAKFNNRFRPEGWLTPTATHLLRTHVNLLNKVRRILPVTDAVFESSHFSLMALESPGIRKWEYQKGPLYGKTGLYEAVDEMQHGKCLLCGNKIQSHHHIIPRSKGGSHTIANVAGLCDDCHYDKVHKSAEWVEKLKSVKAGQNKKYGALSVLNQVIPYLAKQYAELFPEHVYAVEGKSVKGFRDAHRILKAPAHDAACAVLLVLDGGVPDLNCKRHYIQQFRRHDRAVIKSQRNRYYLLDGERVAVNRHKAVIVDPAIGKLKSQAQDSLEEWYSRMVKAYGAQRADVMCSRLTVKKSIRIYNNWKRPMPGSILEYSGRRYVLANNHGAYYGIYGRVKMELPKSKCSVVAGNMGLVYVEELRKAALPPSSKDEGLPVNAA